MAGRDSVVITQGMFYSFAGDEVEITMEEWNGVTDSPSDAESSARSTNPPFAADEIATIREAVVSSPETVQCPRCRCPLTRERIVSGAHVDTLLVACIMCKRTLVIRGQS